DAEPRRVVGDRLRVVAGAHGDDAAPPLVGGEREELVERAALLEGGGELQVLELEEDLRAREARERAAVDERRRFDGPGDAPRRRLHVGERYGKRRATR